jgi:RNA polymerase sigma-70 factor, ECF subfamily
LRAESDETLMLAHQQGDPEAFGELVRRHGDALLGYLVRMSRSVPQAEDCFQETFRKAYERAGSFRGQGRFKSWLYAIATRVALDSRRAQRREPTMMSLNQGERCENGNCAAPGVTVAAPPETDPARHAGLAEQKERLRALLERLPERQRAALVLAYYQGLSYREVAQTLGCSLGAVKTHVFRALWTLARQLPDGLGDNG